MKSPIVFKNKRNRNARWREINELICDNMNLISVEMIHDKMKCCTKVLDILSKKCSKIYIKSWERANKMSGGEEQFIWYFSLIPVVKFTWNYLHILSINLNSAFNDGKNCFEAKFDSRPCAMRLSYCKILRFI